jgi:hypothetical protein
MGAPAQEEQDSLTAARRHPVRWVVIGVVAAVIVGLVVEAAFLLSVRGDLQDGRDALTTARRRALTGDLLAAAGDLREASTAFASASERADGPLGRAARAIPWLGNSAEAAAALADAGDSLSDAGATLVDTLGGLPGGAAALAPSHGALPLDRYRALAAPVQAAAASAAEATTVLAAAPDSLMPGSLASARWDAEAQAARLADDLTGIGSLLGGAPRFGGADGSQRYLVVAQNPAELRGTGGIWGAYAIATIADGRVRVSSAAPTQTLRDFPAGRVESPSEDYARNYDQFGGAGSWQNMNITPDFTAAARAALANYELGEGTRLDGVWAVDPFALADFLHVTGPVTIPGVGDISEDDVVAFTTNRA